MEGVLNSLLSADEICRETSKVQLEEFKNKDPLAFCDELIKILKIHIEENIKLLCIVLLRQSLLSLWQSFNDDSKNSLKSSLLNCIPFINSWNLARNLSATITELAVKIIQSETGEKWPNILSCLITSLQAESPYSKFISFSVLSELIPFFCETFAKVKRKLIPIYIKHLDSPFSELRHSVIHSLTVYISVISTPEANQYAETLKPLLESVQNICIECPEQGQNCIKSLTELVETEPLYFKQDFLAIFSFFEELRPRVQVFVRISLMKFIISLIEKHRGSLMDKRQFLVSICEAILETLVELTPELMTGGEHNSQRCVIGLMRRLINCIGESIVDFLLKKAEWVLEERRGDKDEFVAMVVLGEISEFIYNTDKVDVILKGFNTFIVDNLPGLRWVSFRVVRKLVKIPDEEFQAQLQNSVLELVKGGLQDSEEVILCEVLKVLLKMYQHVDKETLTNRSQELIPLILNTLSKSTCIQYSLEAITNFCMKCKKSIGVCFPLLQNTLLAFITTAESGFRLRALDCLISLRKLVSKEEYISLANECLQIIKYINESKEKLESSTSKALIVLSKCLGKSFAAYLPIIIPDLLNNLVVDSDQVEEYLEVLLAIIDSTAELYLLYFHQTVENLLFVSNTELTDAAKLLVCDLTCVLLSIDERSSETQTKKNISQLLYHFWNWTEQELDFEILIGIIKKIRTIVERLAGFTTEESALFGMNIMKIMQCQRNHSISQEKDQSFIDSSMFEIFQAYFRNPTPPILVSRQSIYSSIHLKLNSQQLSEPDALFGFLLLQNAVLCLLPQFSLPDLEELIKTIDLYLKCVQYKVKKSCLRVLGVLHVHIAKDLFTKLASIFLTQLESILLSIKDSKRLVDLKIKDLTLITIGQLIKYKFDCLSLELIIPWWVSYLPITSHKTQAKIIHDFLADLILHLPFLNPNEKIVTILLSVSFTDLCASSTLVKLSKILQAQTPSSLPAALRTKLVRLQNL